MVPAAKLLMCVLEMHVFRVFCVPASNADDLDTRQGSNRPESARIVSNCLDLHTFCPFLTVFGRKREADQPSSSLSLSSGRRISSRESPSSGLTSTPWSVVTREASAGLSTGPCPRLTATTAAASMRLSQSLPRCCLSFSTAPARYPS
jgi:hypothetical protein